MGLFALDEDTCHGTFYVLDEEISSGRWSHLNGGEEDRLQRGAVYICPQFGLTRVPKDPFRPNWSLLSA